MITQTKTTFTLTNTEVHQAILDYVAAQKDVPIGELTGADVAVWETGEEAKMCAVVTINATEAAAGKGDGATE